MISDTVIKLRVSGFALESGNKANSNTEEEMKVSLKRDFYVWKAGVLYPAEPFFYKDRQEQGVMISMPGWAIRLFVKWEEIESAE